MDGIQIHKTGATPARQTGASEPVAIAPVAAKSTANYLSALGRRLWMVLGVAVPLAVAASIVILKLPPVYLAKAEIEIRAPEIDPHLSTLVGHEVGVRDPAGQAQFVADHEVWIRGRWLAEKVVADPAVAPLVYHMTDPAFELFQSLSVLQNKKTRSFLVTLEGGDPILVKKLLDTLLAIFQKEAKRETENKLVAVRDYAEEDLKTLQKGQKALDAEITKSLAASLVIGPNGHSLIEERYALVSNMLGQKQARLSDIAQQARMGRLFPKFDDGGEGAARASRIAQLKMEARRYGLILERIRHNSRKFNADPAAREWSAKLNGVLDEIDELRSVKTEMAATPFEMIMEEHRREIEADRAEHDRLLAEMQKAVPEFQRIQALMADRSEKGRQVAKLEERITEFKILENAMANGDCVRIPEGGVAEPTAPVKPNRAILIAMALLGSLGLGAGLVCLLEHVDQTVRIPEHATHGLGLQLLGVVPRIRRTSLTQRGGHLCTLATPYSIEADAYRNIRAGLLGVADRRGPITTLLVTSAQTGEGKSTTSLNLAATCARAGERTLLLDVDLRRPSLAEVFITDLPLDNVHGLVDVLKGDLPWQRTVRSTELANLDFIPTGDPRSAPIEILGTLELKQLLAALSGHYDRVILDGPAVLGLADCRVLGRLVDAALLVVRSGAHPLMTLNRAKTMLEQSRVALAGMVFNGLTYDMDDWASYEYQPDALAGAKGLALGSDRMREPVPAGAERGEA